MEEFSRSRYRLESRYEHVLVDEFQDTSRAQWRLVRELVRAWAEGEGLSHGPIPPSIFIVGDRKQSIYGFRDAEVTVLDAAARYIDALRPDEPARAAITRSYRSVRGLLAFVNDVFDAIEKQPERADAFRYDEDDAFPLAIDGRGRASAEALGVVTADTDAAQAEAVGRRDRAAAVERRRGPRSPDRRAAGRSGPATSASCSARARATACSSRRWPGAASRTTSTRASGSSTPTRSRTCSRCSRICADPGLEPAGRGVPAIADSSASRTKR